MRRVSKEKAAQERERLEHEKNDLQKKILLCQQREEQSQHEMKKKEKDIIKLKERIQSLTLTTTGTQSKTKNVGSNFEVYNKPNNMTQLLNQTTPNLSELNQLSLGACEARIDELSKENDKMRETFLKIQNELNTTIQMCSSQTIEIVSEINKSSIHAKKISELPFEIFQDQFEKSLLEKLSTVQQKLASSNKSSSQEQTISKKKFTKKFTKKIVNQYFQKNAEELMGIIAEQDRLLQMSLQENNNEPENFPENTKPLNEMKVDVVLKKTRPETQLSPSSLRLFSPSKMSNMSPIKEIDKENQRKLLSENEEFDFL